MATASTASLVDALRQYRLLEPMQLEELKTLQGRFPDPKALARELMQRGWLTPYQANQLLQGRGKELVLGSYLLLERVGEGGMGEVFKARNWKLGRIVALKLIRKERLDNPDAVRRFEREVRSAAALDHPNIVRALDADQIDGTHLLVMEYIEGATDLSRLVKQNGPLPVPQACEYIRQAALGLQHAHERGMVHRDIKPHNLLLAAQGTVVKILDMGLARLDHPGTDDDKSSTMTQEGAIMGTPDYIAPEQALESHTVDIRGDLYSLGCTFYYLLTGRVPFPGGSLTEKLLKHQLEEPKAVENFRGDVPPGVLSVLRKMMAKKPEDRFQTPAEVAVALAGSFSMDGDPTIAASGSVQVEAKSGDTLDSALSYMAHGGDLAQAEAVRAERAAEGRREWKKLRLAGVVAVLGLVAVVLAVVFLPKGKPPATEPEKDAGKQGLKVEEPIEIDLLALIDPKRDAVKGDWHFDGKTLVLPKHRENSFARLQIPFHPPEEYEIEISTTPEGGLLSIGVVAGQNQVMVDIDSWVPPVSGLTQLDGKLSNSNETTHQGRVLANGKPTRISCLVRHSKIVLICDQKTVINWRGDFGRLSVQAEWRVPDNKAIFLGAWEGVRINKMVLRPLPDSEKEFNEWLASAQKMPADKQVDAVAAMLKEMNPGFGGKVTPKIEGGVVTELSFKSNHVADISPVSALKELQRITASDAYGGKGILSDLSPLKGLPLQGVFVHANRVTNLEPLRGMRLRALGSHSGARIRSLDPLRGMPLEYLVIHGPEDGDFTPLKGMKKLRSLVVYGSPLSDLSILEGMPLTELNIVDTKVASLDPLEGMKVKILWCDGTFVSDLSPLKNMPLVTLRFYRTKVTDLTPLEGMKLEEIRFTPTNITKGMDVLRQMKSLKTIGIGGQDTEKWPAAEFWKKFDAGEFK